MPVIDNLKNFIRHGKAARDQDNHQITIALKFTQQRSQVNLTLQSDQVYYQPSKWVTFQALPVQNLNLPPQRQKVSRPNLLHPRLNKQQQQQVRIKQTTSI